VVSQKAHNNNKKNKGSSYEMTREDDDDDDDSEGEDVDEAVAPGRFAQPPSRLPLHLRFNAKKQMSFKGKK
jgi:hypothetical protein